MEQLTARNIIAAVTALAIIIVVGLGFVIRAGVNEQAQAQDLVTIAQGLQAAYANQSYAYGAVAISSSVPRPRLAGSGGVQICRCRAWTDSPRSRTRYRGLRKSGSAK